MKTTLDAFLGGRVQVRQPAQGYRAGTDPVLLAAACPARDGDTVLDLGCGVGTAALCLRARVPGVQVTGLEVQADYAALARDNGLTVVVGDVAAPPPALTAQTFDHVICNPPYYPPGGGTAARDPAREAALREAVPLATWLDAAIRRLRPKGTLTLIVRTDRLLDALAGIDSRLGGVTLLPLAPRAQKDASRIILQARKGARAAPRILAPLVLHAGPEHVEDGDDFTPLAAQILRGGAAIPL